MHQASFGITALLHMRLFLHHSYTFTIVIFNINSSLLETSSIPWNHYLIIFKPHMVL